MASLVIKKLPDKIHAKLKNSAQSHKRSIIQEAIVLLEKSLMNNNEPLPLPKPIKTRKYLINGFISQAIEAGRP